MTSFSFRMEPIPPFRLDLTAWTLRRRPENLIDRWDGTTYSRILLRRDTPLEAYVSSVGSTDTPRLEVLVRGSRAYPRVEAEVRSALTWLLGSETDLTAFYRFAEQNKRLKPLADRFRGVKPPRFPTLFEALVNAIACQQLSLTVGILLLNRLSAACGKAADSGNHAFPRPSEVLRLRQEDLRGIGFSYAKAGAILELARSVDSGQIDFSGLSELGDKNVREILMQLKGIGKWSAEYAMLRGLGRLSIFPGKDVGARKRIEMLYGRPTQMTYDEVNRVFSRWKPFGGLVYFHLLLTGLAEKGLIKA